MKKPYCYFVVSDTIKEINAKLLSHQEVRVIIPVLNLFYEKNIYFHLVILYGYADRERVLSSDALSL